MKATDPHPDLALLTPVPLDHLEDSTPTAEEWGKVAFGSNAWEVFRELDRLRGSLPVKVFIYASHSTSPVGLKVSWTGNYIGYVHSVGGAHPERERFRSPIAAKEDSAHFWGGFWEVEGLRRMDPVEFLAISDLRGWKKQTYFKANFIPEGPLLVERPT